MHKVTMEDVAAAAGVSRALVSIAFRGVEGVSDKTRARIFEVASQLGYTPNRIAARLAGKGNDTIGVFLQDLHNDVFADIYDGIRSITEPLGIQLVLAVGGTTAESEQRALATLLGSRVDIVLAAGLTLSDESVTAFAKQMRLVSVARKISGIDSVYSNNFVGAQLAVDHLVAHGHARIAFLANPQTDGYLDRQAGYLASMASYGLEPQIQPTTYLRAQAAIDAGELLDGPVVPTAIFAHNDVAALGVMDAMLARNLVPGQDLQVVGYDNSTLAHTPMLALTTVDLRAQDLGRAAAELAVERLNGQTEPRLETVLEPNLVVRG